jgi:uncharacterized protein YsxB (DUF464 family)
MKPATISALALASLNVIDKFLDKLPNYHQKKKEEYRRLKLNFINEKTREDRILNHLEHHLDKLTVFLETFEKELESDSTSND